MALRIRGPTTAPPPPPDEGLWGRGQDDHPARPPERYDSGQQLVNSACCRASMRSCTSPISSMTSTLRGSRVERAAVNHPGPSILFGEAPHRLRRRHRRRLAVSSAGPRRKALPDLGLDAVNDGQVGLDDPRVELMVVEQAAGDGVEGRCLPGPTASGRSSGATSRRTGPASPAPSGLKGRPRPGAGPARRGRISAATTVAQSVAAPAGYSVAAWGTSP